MLGQVIQEEKLSLTVAEDNRASIGMLQGSMRSMYTLSTHQSAIIAALTPFKNVPCTWVVTKDNVWRTSPIQMSNVASKFIGGRLRRRI